MACRPATPAPMTNTRAGGIVPAGVVIMGKILLCRSAARITATYPARFACELSTSIFWAIVVRGIISRLIPLTFLAVSRLMTSGLLNGSR